MNFRTLGVLPELCSALARQHIASPTSIQTAAIPSLLHSDTHHLLAAQSGTGKTFAYLLPVMQRLFESQTDPPLHQPRSVIVLPNPELTAQLRQVLHLLPSLVSHATSISGQREVCTTPDADMYLGTPERLCRQVSSGVLQFDAVKHVVIDEFDTLLETGFRKSLVTLIEAGLAAQSQFIFVSATLPKQSEVFLSSYFSHYEDQALPYLHCVFQKKTHTHLRHITHRFIELTECDRLTALCRVLEEDSESVLVFCNTVKTTDAVTEALTSRGVAAASLHGDMSVKQRRRSIEGLRSKAVRVLVCTDLGSRGLDFPFLKTVVQYDFPLTPSDYLHRAGRTGRAGQPGTVVTLHQKNDTKIVIQLKQAFEKRKPLLILDSALSLHRKKAAKSRARRSE